MILFHYTHKDNRVSIARDGLRLDRARPAPGWHNWRRVFLYDELTMDRLARVARVHGWRLEDVVAYRVELPAGMVVRWDLFWLGRKVYTVDQGVPAAWLRLVGNAFETGAPV